MPSAIQVFLHGKFVDTHDGVTAYLYKGVIYLLKEVNEYLIVRPYRYIGKQKAVNDGN